MSLNHSNLEVCFTRAPNWPATMRAQSYILSRWSYNNNFTNLFFFYKFAPRSISHMLVAHLLWDKYKRKCAYHIYFIGGILTLSFQTASENFNSFFRKNHTVKIHPTKNNKFLSYFRLLKNLAPKHKSSSVSSVLQWCVFRPANGCFDDDEWFILRDPHAHF